MKDKKNQTQKRSSRLSETDRTNRAAVIQSDCCKKKAEIY